MTYVKRQKGSIINCEVRESLENELCYFSKLFVTSARSQTHFPTLPSLYLRHSSFSNHSVGSPTSQFILQPFFRFSYVTSSSLNSPGEPPMVWVFMCVACVSVCACACVSVCVKFCLPLIISKPLI